MRLLSSVCHACPRAWFVAEAGSNPACFAGPSGFAGPADSDQPANANHTTHTDGGGPADGQGGVSGQVAEYPLASLLIAGAVGFGLGLLVSGTRD